MKMKMKHWLVRGGAGGGGVFTLSTKSLDFVFSACGGKNSLADLT